MIADEVNVSPATIRNRIDQLEEHGIIQGYPASIDLERAGDKLTYLYICTAPTSNLESLAKEVRTISGVTNVRELLSGSRNLHVLAAGETTEDFRQIMRSLSDLGLEVADKHLVQNETFEPFDPYGPDDTSPAWQPTDLVSLAGGANVVEVTVPPEAPIVELSLSEAARREVLDDEALVVAIERDGEILTPHGETVVESEDVVTLVARGSDPERTLDAFQGNIHSEG